MIWLKLIIFMFRNKDDITLERLMYAKIFILAGPQEKISASEVMETSSLILWF